MRTIDTSLLTSWLTLRAVEQHSRQIDAIERSGREPGLAKSMAPAKSENNRPAMPGIPPNTTSGLPAHGRAPALPPPVNVPAAPKPRAVPRADNTPPSPLTRSTARSTRCAELTERRAIR